jgi:hypothetical protein
VNVVVDCSRDPVRLTYLSDFSTLLLFQLRRSLKLKPGKRKEKVKLPSGITADYSSAFFAQLDSDKGKEQDRGQEEVLHQNSTTIQENPKHKSPAIPPRGILKNAKTKYSSDTGQQIGNNSANNSPDGSSIEVTYLKFDLLA